MGHNDEIVLARVRISTLEMIIEDIHVGHQTDMKSLLDKVRELKNHQATRLDPCHLQLFRIQPRDMRLVRTLSCLKYLRWAEESIEEDDRKRTRFRDGKISSGRKKSRGSNNGDSDMILL
nr:hypothetical protein [Tanacetum cinerariifolium]